MKIQRYDIDYRTYNMHDCGDWCKEDDVLELEKELEIANEKCRQYEQLILDNANKNI